MENVCLAARHTFNKPGVQDKKSVRFCHLDEKETLAEKLNVGSKSAAFVLDVLCGRLLIGSVCSAPTMTENTTLLLCARFDWLC